MILPSRFSHLQAGAILPLWKGNLFLQRDGGSDYLQGPEFLICRRRTPLCKPSGSSSSYKSQSNTACPGQSCFGKTCSSPARSKKKASTPLPKCCQLHLNRKAPLRCRVRLGSAVPVTSAGWNTLEMPLHRDVVPACGAVYCTVPPKRYSWFKLGVFDLFYLLSLLIKSSISLSSNQLINLCSKTKNRYEVTFFQPFINF